jgi:EAL domain-containing protein (putative c-di-GMP-specific phosphodiesterase class I)/GGDEF domain-containing protein
MRQRGSVSEIAHAQFQSQLRQAIQSSQRSGRSVGLLLIDFPASTAEMPADQTAANPGESVLKIIGSALRDSDSLCRVAGNPMAVLLPSLGSAEDAVLVAGKILHRLALAAHRKEEELPARIGVALYPDHAHSAPLILRCAQVALHAARSNNQPCVIYSSLLSGSARPPLHLRELRQAILEHQLFLLYQPKVDLRTGAITGVESLTRWRHPVYGLVMPDEFIPLAERTGLIVPLTLWVLEEAIHQCRRWQSEGIGGHIAVNLSMWNLDGRELPGQIAQLLKTAGVSPAQLELEITETAIMDDPQNAMKTLREIRELGVRLAIDDFGTGYSSLAHLIKMPVTSVKVDKSFTMSMETDRDSAVIVRAIVELGHNLGLKVVAEGVETLAVKRMLTAFGCDEAQGYYFSRPVTAADISRLVADTPGDWGETGPAEERDQALAAEPSRPRGNAVFD